MDEATWAAYGNQIVGEKIVLDRANRLPRWTRLIDCHVFSTQSVAGLFFSEILMRGGVFEQKTVLRHHNFNRVHFEGVRFLGTYVGCDWGFHALFDPRDIGGPAPHSGRRASIRGGSFAGARTDYCRLFDGDVDRLSLPTWPCFTIRDPTRHLQPLRGTWGNPELEIAFNPRVGDRVAEDTVATFSDARTLAKLAGMDLVSLREAIGRITSLVVVEA